MRNADPIPKKEKILIVGRNYSSNLCLARSFGRFGYDAEILRTFSKKPKFKQFFIPESFSKYVKSFNTCVISEEENNLIDKLIKLSGNEKKLLIPSDDLAVSIIDSHLDELSEYYLIPSIEGKQGKICELMSKERQKTLAADFGIPVAKSCRIKIDCGEFEIPDGVCYPCFVKPNASIGGFKTQMKRCEDRKQLEDHLSRFSKDKETELLVEEYLEIKTEYSLLGLSTKEKTIAPGFFMAEKGGHYSHQGVAMTGVVLPTEERQELIDKLVRFVSSLNYEGLYDIDLIETEDGEMYFAELNFRYGGSGYAITESGMNLPGIFAEYMLEGKKIPEENTVVPGKHFLSEMIAADELNRKYIASSELFELKRNADITFIDDPYDRKPYIIFVFLSFLKILRDRTNRRIRKIKGSIRRTIRRVFLLGEKRVLIVGLNYGTNLSLARSFGEAGYPVSILRLFWENKPLRQFLCPERFSRYVKHYYSLNAEKDPKRLVDKLIKIRDSGHEYLLIPADDLVLTIVDEHYDLLSNYYILPNIDHTQGKICQMMQKDVQKELAKKCGLKVAKGRILKYANGSYKIPEEVSYPCFIKPLHSGDHSKSYLGKYDTREQLCGFLDPLDQNITVDFEIEDYIDVAREYSVGGLSSDGNVLIPAVLKILRSGSGERRGVAITGEVRPVSEYKDLIEKLTSLMKLISYEGLFDIDLLEDKSGSMYFSEVNYRLGASGRALDGFGINLPEKYARYVFEGTRPEICEKLMDRPLSYVNDRVLIHEYVTTSMSRKEVKAIKRTSEYSFFSDLKDPIPDAYFRTVFLPAPIAKSLIKLKKKRP